MRCLLVFISISFVFSGCVINETDFDFYIINKFQESIRIEFYLNPSNESIELSGKDTLALKSTYSNATYPALTNNEFSDEFGFISIIRLSDSMKVSEGDVKQLNGIKSWNYEHLEDIRYYQHHQYTIQLNKENLGF